MCPHVLSQSRHGYGRNLHSSSALSRMSHDVARCRPVHAQVNPSMWRSARLSCSTAAGQSMCGARGRHQSQEFGHTASPRSSGARELGAKRGVTTVGAFASRLELLDLQVSRAEEDLLPPERCGKSKGRSAPNALFTRCSSCVLRSVDRQTNRTPSTLLR